MSASKLLYLLSLSLICRADNQLTPEKFEGDIQRSTLHHHISNLNDIAQKHGGNRAFGFPGYDASVDYIFEQLGNSSKLDVSVQPFTHLFSTTTSISLIDPENEEVPVVSLQYNHATSSDDGVSAPLVHFPIDDERGTGCTNDQWNGTDYRDKIPLIKRGTKCHPTTVLKLAKSHGAPAVLIYNNVPGVTGGSGSLGAENYGTLAPLGVITFEQGTAWAKRTELGEKVRVNFHVDVLTEERETHQVFVETKEGDPNNVIMLGAHLDSVQEGPGLNDNGSGVTTLLAIAQSFTKYTGFNNKLRFAFWGAEESGMIGSLRYTSGLCAEEVKKIRFYFNYDMVASPEPGYLVYADSDADLVGAQILSDFLTVQDLPAEIVPFGSSSDYVGFLELGIPSSGIFTGAGPPYDSCYHSKCDGLDNVNWDALTVNAKAAGYAAAQLALATDSLPEHGVSTLNPRTGLGAVQSLRRWASEARGFEKSHSCGGLH